jgi:hypothetical protein
MIKGFVAAVLLIGLALCLWILGGHTVQNPFEVPIVTLAKLSEITNSSMEIKFTYPKANQCSLLLGYPGGLPIKLMSQSTISVYSEDGNVSVPLDETNIVKCNWLDRFALSGCLISQPGSSSWDWNKKFRGQSTNFLVLSNIPMGGSVWLSYTRPSGWNLK